jgi:hypothetical protein
MTKDGRPSLITDIRLFAGERYNSAPYLEGQEEAVAYGRRIAWLLNSEGFSLGAFPALYVLFTPLLERVQSNSQMKAATGGSGMFMSA